MESTGPHDAIWHFDGVTALRHHPRVEWDEHGFYLDWGEARSGPHRWRLLEPFEARAGALLFGLADKPGWRLGFDAPPPPDLAVHLPQPARYGRWIDHLGLWPAAIMSAVFAAAILLLVVQMPQWLAPLIPRSWENAMGDAMVGDFGGRVCETPASKAALAKLTAELAQGTQLRQVAIVNVPIVNAVAMPGGRIYIFDELVQEAKSPDELAGILAHEIGHVRNRDTVTALVRQFGLSIVLGGADANVAGLLNGVLSMSYSRSAERAADDFSIEALRDADISPAPTAGFFGRLSASGGGEKIERFTGWLASHPVSADRERAFTDSSRRGHRYAPALDAGEWAALRKACEEDPDVREDEDFSFGF